MSWDIFVQDFPRDIRSITELPAGFTAPFIGERSAIIEKIKDIVPTADFSDPAWGRIDGEDWSIEVNFGASEDCDGFALHVRGGDAVVGVVAAIVQHLNLRAVDSQTGDFFVPGAAGIDGLRNWRAYRDQVLRNSDNPPDK